jgi:hypothetical protein
MKTCLIQRLNRFCCLGLLAAGMVILMMPANVQAQYEYTTNADNTITITGYTGSNKVLNIANKINGRSVTCIGGAAFYELAYLTSVTIPNGVTNIGFSAFWNCSSLTNATIPNTVINIGSFALNRTCLSKVTIPASVTTIGIGALWTCTNLMEIAVNPSNSIYSSVGGVLFNKNQTMLIQYPGGRKRCYTIPNGVTSIDGAFCESYYITSVTIPASVTSIGDGAFYCCTNLTALYFEGDAPSLFKFEEPEPAFAGDSITTVYYLPGTTGWGAIFGEDHDNPFYISAGCPTSLWLPQICSSCIQSNAFSFNINWASGKVAVVECSTNLLSSSWQPVQTNNMQADTCNFSDPNWTKNPVCFYRVVWQ